MRKWKGSSRERRPQPQAPGQATRHRPTDQPTTHTHPTRPPNHKQTNQPQTNKNNNRREAILKAHPEIRKLFGPCPWTKYKAAAVILTQVGSSFFFVKGGWGGVARDFGGWVWGRVVVWAWGVAFDGGTHVTSQDHKHL